MLKWNRDKMKGFAMGVATVALFGSLVGTAFASGKLTSINVMKGGIKLFVDGKLIIPTDGNGTVVEPFIYEGTTYLPLRALSNALTNNQKPVKWDGDNSSIYIGQAPVSAQTDISELKPYDGVAISSGKDAIFKVLDKEIAPFNRLRSTSSDGIGSFSYTYMLHSEYRSLNGQFVIPYSALGSKDSGTIKFFNVNKKGEETLIKEYSAKAGDDTLQVEVNLQGVEILKIKFDGYSAFYNVTLAGIE